MWLRYETDGSCLQKRGARILEGACFACLFLLWAPALRAQPSSPAEDTGVSPAQEYAMARGVRERFLGGRLPLVSTDPMSERVRDVGLRLTSVCERSDLSYTTAVLPSDDHAADFQAWSLPGGTVYLSRALVDLYRDSDDELAFALAHELAHVGLRHHISPEGSAGVGHSQRAWMRIRRRQEFEADRYGAMYLVRAGFRFSASIDSLEALQRVRKGAAEVAGYPEYDDRIAMLHTFRLELERSIEAFHLGTNALDDGRSDAAIDALGLFVRQFPSSFAGRINLGSAYLGRLRSEGGAPGGLEEPWIQATDPGVILRGGYDVRDLADARRHFRAALSLALPDARPLLGLALLSLREGNFERADQLLRRAHALDPEDPDVVLASGNSHYLQGRPGDAAERYSYALKLANPWPQAEKNLAMAYDAGGRIDLARRRWSRLSTVPRYREEAVLQLARMDRR